MPRNDYDPNAFDSDPDGPVFQNADEFLAALLEADKPKRRRPLWVNVAFGIALSVAVLSGLIWCASAVLANANIWDHALGFFDSVALGFITLFTWVMFRAMSTSN